MDNILKKMQEGIEYPFLVEFLKEPSKRIRSRLAILYLKSCEQRLNDDIYNILAAGEIIHNASLLHDDVIDEAIKRRGNTTIGAKHSYKLSIVAGDYLLTNAISKILKINNSEILGIFQNCVKLMSEGEINQYFLRGKIPSKEEYISICNKKTGALFAAILESCAILTGIDRQNAGNFAKLFGLYFQIKNDLEDESAANDAKNKVFTAKYVLGIENTMYLLDNLRGDLRKILGVFPESSYRQELEGLFKQ